MNAPLHNEAAAAVAGSVLLLAYAVLAMLRPAPAFHAVNREARLLWVRGVMRDRSKDVMAVQSLRNYVMTATFKASSAVLLIIGTLTLSAQAESLSRTWWIAGAQGDWLLAKLLCLLVVLIAAFFAFAMVLRHLNHVLFMIGLPAAEASGPFAPEAIAARLNRAGLFYTLGMRAYFLTIPLVFWLFGPLLLPVATAAVVALFLRMDR
ncbi:DUF599 domain-containing protein [Noviherbaspirillum denitrificans]|uniref:DUF599 domain-containing protein n=1 Tax=Noviherbaspirillum denitrificans TaxID=1968433 RepID=A0A254TBW0_9BURK|nr:DUF599 domain-containing protein [Noviherbaspirillum denitrificans]OWW20146.1 hypothetical protein AYR66_12215 [Noviherbaspirillum denitrificans]